MPTSWRRPTRSSVAAVVVLLVAATAACGGSSSGSFLGQTDAQIVAAAQSAALARGSVAITSTGFVIGRHDSLTQTSSLTAAQRIFTIGTATGRLLVVDRTAYFLGNATALRTMLLLSPAQAAANAGRWIAVSAKERVYAQLTNGLTLASLLAGLEPRANLTRLRETSLQGQLVVGIRGHFTGSDGYVTVYVAVRAPHLPVESTWTLMGDSADVVLSRWGTPVQVVAPAGTTALSQITGR